MLIFHSLSSQMIILDLKKMDKDEIEKIEGKDLEIVELDVSRGERTRRRQESCGEQGRPEWA